MVTFRERMVEARNPRKLQQLVRTCGTCVKRLAWVLVEGTADLTSSFFSRQSKPTSSCTISRHAYTTCRSSEPQCRHHVKHSLLTSRLAPSSLYM